MVENVACNTSNKRFCIVTNEYLRYKQDEKNLKCLKKIRKNNDKNINYCDAGYFNVKLPTRGTLTKTPPTIIK